jgi:CubicO group peptidase (beta-lactamase class C family)
LRAANVHAGDAARNRRNKSNMKSQLMRGLRARCLAAVCALFAGSSLCFSAPMHAASNPVRLGAVDSIIEQAVADGNIPGAVLLVGHDGKVVYRKAYGHRSLEPRRESMTVDTIFDMASLTKVIATNTSVMQLAELGKIRFNDPVSKYLPDFAQNGKQDITIRQLLTHYSGLAPDLDLTTPWSSPRRRRRAPVGCTATSTS